MAEWLLRETQNLLIAGPRSNPRRPRRFCFTNSKLVSVFFPIAFSRAVFFVVFWLVFAKLRLRIKQQISALKF